jgi:hypothetical protein
MNGKTMARTFAKISIDELRSKIEDKKSNYKDWVWDDHFYKTLTRQIEKDLSKVEFDTENVECKSYYPKIDAYEKILGYHTLDNGLSFLGITAGGDWESPVFFIIYFDGYKLRGYIPEKGNSWCKKTKSAYGNGDTDADDAPAFNIEELIRDIQSRIKEKPSDERERI